MRSKKDPPKENVMRTGSKTYLGRAKASVLVLCTTLAFTGMANAQSGGVADLQVTDYGVSLAPLVGEIFAGQSFTVTNLGPDTATNIKVHLTLPSNVSLNPSQAYGATYVDSTTCSIGSLGVNQYALVLITFKADAPGAGEIKYAVSADQTDPNASNNSTTRPVHVLGTALGITGSGPASALKNTRFSLTYVITNLGPGDATGVAFDEVLQGTDSSGDYYDQLTYVDSSSTQGDCSVSQVSFQKPGGGTYQVPKVSCAIGTIPVGGQVTVTVGAKVGYSETINYLQATASAPEARPASSTLSVTVGNVDLTLNQALSTTDIRIGDTFSYTVSGTNNGPDVATQVDIFSQFNGSLMHAVSATSSQGSCSLSSNSVSCDLGTLAAGASYSMTVTLTAVSPSSSTYLINTIGSADHDVTTGNNSKTLYFAIKALTPPVAAAGANQTAHVGSLVTLDGSGSADTNTPPQTPLTYAWTLVSKPAGSSAEIASAAAVSPTFRTDVMGAYVASLAVTNAAGLTSAPSVVTVSTSNSVPVADAGPDQSIILVNSVVQLDGSQSYDPDGDAIAYQWTLLSAPQGSAATLSDPTSARPTFTADLHGTYVARLVVSDPWDIGAPDDVTVSFSNVRPIASVGAGGSTLVGTKVTLDGSASSDANGDPLTFLWTINSAPTGSRSVVINPTSAVASFVPDLPGTYVAQLVANDGYLNSEPSTVSWLAVTNRTLAIKAVQAIQNAIAGLPGSAFKNRNMAKAFINKLNATIRAIEERDYADALDQLEDGILAKVDGCVTGSPPAPDRNDWIVSYQAQLDVYWLTVNAIDQVKSLMKSHGPCDRKDRDRAPWEKRGGPRDDRRGPAFRH
jgi:hypothetical protein